MSELIGAIKVNDLKIVEKCFFISKTGAQLFVVNWTAHLRRTYYTLSLSAKKKRNIFLLQQYKKKFLINGAENHHSFNFEML